MLKEGDVKEYSPLPACCYDFQVGSCSAVSAMQTFYMDIGASLLFQVTAEYMFLSSTSCNGVDFFFLQNVNQILTYNPTWNNMKAERTNSLVEGPSRHLTGLLVCFSG